LGVVFSGCISDDKKEGDLNLLPGLESQEENMVSEIDDMIDKQAPLNDASTEDLLNPNELSNSDNMTYCIGDMGGIVYEYFFTNETSLMKTTVESVSWNKIKVDKDLSCSWENLSGVAPQCIPVSEAGGFSQVVASWKENAKVICQCDDKVYSDEYFQVPGN